MTRPLPAAAGTAARLLELGHEAVLAPCLIVSPRAAALPANPAALVLTSGHAVPALPPRYRDLPAFCVGDVTATRLRQAGFNKVESAGGDAEDLRRLVIARDVAGLHLLAVGAAQGEDLARRLGEAGILVERRVVYAAAPAPALPEAAVAALAGAEIGAALFYSAETAQAFIGLAPSGTGSVAAYALSPRVGAALAGLPWRAIHVAVAPNEAELLALLHE